MEAKAAEEFASLVEGVARREDEKNIVGAVRCWNKSSSDLEALLSRIAAMKRVLPELRGIFVVINADQDEEHMTRKGLLELVHTQGRDFSVIPLDIEKYSWTAGLNGPAALLARGLTEEGGAIKSTDIFNFSFGVEFDRASFVDLARRYRDNTYVATIRLNRGRKPAVTRDDVMGIIKNPPVAGVSGNISRIFANPDIMAVARNTATIMPLEEIIALGGYDSARNATGGMEDHDFLMRLLLDALRLGKMGKISAISRALEEPVYYTDHDWDALPDERRAAKLEDEQKALRSVAESLLSRSGTENWSTPLERQDFKFA